MLFRKFLRDLWHNKIQFISIFIMAALSTYIFAGMGSLYNGLDRELQEYYKKTNYAQYKLYNGQGFESEDIRSLSDIEHIDKVEKRYIIDSAVATDYDNSAIELNIVESDYKVSQCIVVKGSNIDNSKDAIWIDYRYAKEKHIKVGDRFTIGIEGNKFEKEVKGLVINPEYIYQVNADNIIPNHDDMGFAFSTYDSFEDVVLDKANAVVISMDYLEKNDKDAKNKVSSNIISKLNNGNVAYSELTEEDIEQSTSNYDIFSTRDDVAGHVMFNQAIEQYRAIGIVFPLAFLAVTVLTMLTTMTRLVDKQRIEIGTLGTLGLKKDKIYRHYISFGFFPAFIGCLVGMIAAPFTLPYTFYGTLDTLYTMEEWKPALPYSSCIIVVLCIGLCMGVTYITIRKVLKETPAQAIKPKVSEEINDSKLLQSDMANNMNFALKWNLIDLIKGKVRAIMTVVGMAGCIGLLIAGFGFRDSLNQVVIDQYDRIFQYNTKMALDSTIMATEKSQEVKKDINDTYTNVEYMYEGKVEIRSEISSNQYKRKISNLTVGSNIKNIKYYNEEGKSISMPTNGVNLSRKLAKSLGVDEGDTIKIKLFGTKEYKNVNVEKIYVSPVTQGMFISEELFENIGYTFIANYATTTDVIVHEDLSKNIDSKNSENKKIRQNVSGKTKKYSKDIDGIVKIITKSKLQSDYEVTKKTLDSISLILMASAILLAVVVLYNLNMLSLYEKQNEFALFKVLGFKDSRIRNLLLRQTLLLVVVGVLVGIPFGLGLLYIILNTMGDSVDMLMTIKPLSYYISLVLTCGISIIMNLCFVFNIKKINMVSSLKNVE
ncbi:MAG: ABC transporter permease [Lachnospiraceae bacterium]|nr:ABC transporter permease [Lachnospiraceae bacterium]